MKGYHNYLDISKELNVNSHTLKKALKDNDLIHEPWVVYITDICEVYKLRKKFGFENAKELLLVSSQLKRLIFKEYKRCHGTKFKPNFESIRKDIEMKKIRIATSKEIKSKQDLEYKINKPAELKLAVIKSYTDIMLKLGVDSTKVTAYALDCVDKEEDPFSYVNDINQMAEVSLIEMKKEIISNKIMELEADFNDSLEARKRFCMALSKQTGFELKYVNKSMDNIFNIIETLNVWETALEICEK